MGGMSDVIDAGASARRLTMPSQKGRSLTPPDYGQVNATAGMLAVAWLLPWSSNNYPGRRRGAEELLQWRANYPAVRMWKVWPTWALVAVRAAVMARLERGAEVVRQIDEALASTPLTRNVGFCEVREDGRDRRGNWRK